MTVTTEPPAIPAVSAREHVNRGGPRKRETFEVLAPLASARPARIVGPIVIGAVSAAVMFLRMFFPAPIGLANNGEGTAFSCQLGMQPVLPNGVGAAWSYAILDWIVSVGALDPACVAYPSGEVAILRAAQFITHVLGAPGTVNLRYVMIGYCLFVGVMLALVAHVVRRGLATRIVITGVLFVVLADGAVVGYAGSTQGELPGILGTIAVAVGAIYAGLTGSHRMVGMVLVLIGSGGLLMSVPAAVVAVIPVTVFLLVQAFRREQPVLRSRRSGGIRVVNGVLGRTAALAVAGCILFIGFWSIATGPTNHRSVNPYHVLAFGILGNSDDPESDLEAMGLPPELERYTNQSVWVQDSIITDPIWARVKDDITYASVTGFLVTHPDRAWTVANTAANEFYLGRPSYLGSYTADSGEPPQTLEGRLSVASGLMRTVAGLGMIPLLVFWALVTFGGIQAIRTGSTGSIRRALGMSSLLMLATSITLFASAAFGDGVETTKHMVLSIFSFLLSPALLLGALLAVSKNGADEDEVFVPRLTLT